MDLIWLLEQAAAATLNRINRFTFVRETQSFVCEKTIFHKLCQGIRALSGWHSFLGAFTKLRKATVSFSMSVCPSASYNSSPGEKIFIKVSIRVIYENLEKKFKFY